MTCEYFRTLLKMVTDAYAWVYSSYSHRVLIHLDHTLLISIFGHHMLEEKAKLMW